MSGSENAAEDFWILFFKRFKKHTLFTTNSTTFAIKRLKNLF
ncbi:hypothetical protein B0H94_105116 [Salsuginibacillus halophilus]|uniref:Uncharacterized protein n=1 Tax=Salsuginibacillus halophilus TaxID=517424 RepID=A0A2P8HL73_9BACI|nr:hypothetical protein B0H94_105116 [Salsuginibacillus halophilus]